MKHYLLFSLPEDKFWGDFEQFEAAKAVALEQSRNPANKNAHVWEILVPHPLGQVGGIVKWKLNCLTGEETDY